MASMDRFDFQSPASWGVPDYSPYPLPKSLSEVSPEEFIAGVEATMVKDGGAWRATWEYRIGGTTRVEITSLNFRGSGDITRA